MKILLVTLNAKYIHTSLALRYLREYIKPDHTAGLLEFTINEPIEDIADVLVAEEPDVIAFSCYIWNIEQTIELINKLRISLPNLCIIVGGPEVSFELEYWLNRVPAIDYIIYGEGEQSFKELLEYLDGKKPLESLKGIAYRLTGANVLNPPQDLLVTDDIPSPYTDEELPALKNRTIYFEASRGCPFLCSYCLSSLDRRVRFFSLDRVQAELTRLLDADVQLVKFVDRTFNIKQDFAQAIFTFLIDDHLKHNRRTTFHFEITADLLSDDLVKYLAANAPPGLFRMEIGVQTTNEHTNKLIDRKQDWERLSSIIKQLRAGNNIMIHLDLIAGLPAESYDSFGNSFNMTYELGAQELQLGFLKVLRGTKIWREQDLYGYRFHEKPPYEVIENDSLTVNELAKIKLVEAMLERYSNSGRMPLTIKYLVSSWPAPATDVATGSDAFDFFLRLGEYWEDQGYARIGYQLDELFNRLYGFLEQEHANGIQVNINIDFVHDLMKCEFFANFKHKPRRLWWNYIFDKKRQSAVLNKLAEQPTLAGSEFAELRLSREAMRTHLMLDWLDHDLGEFFNSGEIVKRPTIQIIYFDFQNQSRSFFLNSNFLVNC